MENFTYTVHVTFIRMNEKMIPWIVSITSVTELETTKIGLSPKGLTFEYEDIEYNKSTTDCFPRSDDDKSLDYEFKLNIFDCNFKYVYENMVHNFGRRIVKFNPEGEKEEDEEDIYEKEQEIVVKKVLALDIPTFNYLSKIVPVFNPNLKLPQMSCPDYMSLAAAWRYQMISSSSSSSIKQPKSYFFHVEFFKINGKLEPWYISVTATSPEDFKLETTIFSLSTKGLIFSHEDIKYNESFVENFYPKFLNSKDFVCTTIDELGSKFREYYKDLLHTWCNVMAVDRHTYNYLSNLCQYHSLKLLNPKSRSEEKTFTAAYKQSLFTC